MLLHRVNDIRRKEVNDSGAHGLVYHGPVDTVAFRLNYVELEPGGQSRDHAHEWIQVNYIIKGRGKAVTGAGQVDVEAGDFVEFEPNESHYYANNGKEPLVIVGVLGPESIGD